MSPWVSRSDAMEKEKALARMMKLCSMSEHCKADIFKKLERCEVANSQEIVEKLCSEGYIDEARYARAFVRDKSSLDGWGCAKIRVALQRKGISSEDISNAIAEMDDEAAWRKFLSTAKAKWKSIEKESDSVKRQAKFFRFALGRGYGYDQIKKAYDIVRTDKRD